MIEVIMILIFVSVMILLAKKGKLIVSKKRGYRMKKGTSHLSVSYKKFNGIDNYIFSLPSRRQLKINYNVVVSQGKVKIMIGKAGAKVREENCIFVKEFEKDEIGEYEFFSEYSYYGVFVYGTDTVGSYNIEFV